MIEDLEKIGIAFKALNSPMDKTTPAGRAFLQIQAAFAEMERNRIRQRVNEGLTAARARGRQGGRPRVMTPERLRFVQHLMADKSRTIPQICRELGRYPLKHALSLPARRRYAEGSRTSGEGGHDVPHGGWELDDCFHDRPRSLPRGRD